MPKENCRVYESRTIQQVTGDTVRPGGFTLTDRAINICSFPAGSKVLDVGCGSGATVERLINQYCLRAIGIDPSPVMLAKGKQRNAELPIFNGAGESIPFNDSEMAGVFAECTLSLMDNLPSCLTEMHRVLAPQGKLIVADVYIRNNATMDWQADVACCFSGAQPKDNLLKVIKDAGFTIELWEDHTQLLRELAVQLIFTHGSINAFWCQMLGNCQQAQKIQQLLQRVKVGYFLLIASKKKGEDNDRYNLSHV